MPAVLRQMPCFRAAGTGEVVFADRGHGAAAGGAEHLAGEDVLCAPVLPEFGAVRIVGPGRLAHVGEARLHTAPQLLIDDPQMRHLLGHPLLRRVHAGDAFARGRVLDEAHAVPHQAADIQLVAQDAGAARGMATDGGVTPGAALGAGEGFGIQCLGDGDG